MQNLKTKFHKIPEVGVTLFYEDKRMDIRADMTTLTINFETALRKIRNKFIENKMEWRMWRSTVQDKRLLSCLLEGDGVLSPYTLDLWLKIESRNLPRHEVCKQRDKLIPYMPPGSVVSTDNGAPLQVERQTLKSGFEIISSWHGWTLKETPTSPEDHSI